MIPQTISHYRVIKKLGAGGMGEVYLAEDTKLARKVAVKFLPKELTVDDQAKRRLLREARAAATLDHPNICAIHEVGEENNHSFIVMQYIEGETLADRIRRQPLELSESLMIAVQIADALVEAHSQRVIHRDIKPQNIMITTRGQVKVLDFGLAKVMTDGLSVGSEAETQSLLSAPGVIIGTVPYMSPEQVKGEAVDTRSDSFSFGVLLYEMVSGRQPFMSENKATIISAILNREPPPLARFSPEVPTELERIVTKALRKNREERYQGIKDLALDLKNLREQLEFEARLERSQPPDVNGVGRISAGSNEPTLVTRPELPANSEMGGSQPRSSAKLFTGTIIRHKRTAVGAGYIVSEIKRHKWNVAVALTLGSLVVSAALWYLLPRLGSRTQEASTSLRNATFTQLTDQSGPEYFPSLSPDGKSMVYASYAAGSWDIYLQRVGGKNPINLTKDSPADDTQPAFSPDGERIAFRSEREGGGIFVMGATGESVRRLSDFGNNPAWSPDGKEIACADEGPVDPAIRGNPNSRVWAVNVATGERRQVTKEDSIQPNWSPHGIRIAYGGRRNATQRDIWTIPAGGGEPTEVTNDPAVEGSPVWSPDGKYLYFASDRAGSMNVWRVPIEEQTGRVLGPPEAVTTPSPYSAHLSFSPDGRRMVYSQILSRGNLQQVGFDPDKETVTGQPVWITQGSRWANTPNLSPDGEWLAFDSQRGKQDDLFVIRRDGTGLRQLTDDLHKDRQPRWSPDGKRIAFFSDRTGKWEIWTINSDGSGLKQLTYAPGLATNPTWSPDGTRLAYRNPVGSPSIIEVEKPWTEQSPQVLPAMSDLIRWGAWSWSLDGRKLAGNILGAGNPDGILVYSLEAQHYERLTDFGRNPVWLSDSRRLLFQNQGKLYLIDSQSKKVRELFSVAPDEFGLGVTISRDDHQIYFSLVTMEADIWLMSLE
jgi:eukaryotic-like serine/threonine-protein kinase